MSCEVYVGWSSLKYWFGSFRTIEHPEIKEELKSNPKELVENLKKVRISSEGYNKDIPIEGEKPLPSRRTFTPPHLVGMVEPHNVPAGRISLSMLLELYKKRTADETKWTFDALGKEFKMDPKHIEQILDNFRPFQVFRSPKVETVPWYSTERMENVVVGHGYYRYLDEKQAQEEAEEKKRVDDLAESRKQDMEDYPFKKEVEREIADKERTKNGK